MNPKYEMRYAITGFTSAGYGYVAGPLFSLIFGTLVLFTGSFADRYTRKYLLGFAAICWSITTLGTSISHSFWAICLCRMLLGVFESVCAPSAYSLIADYFPPEVRTTANAYFAGCIFVGAALASASTAMIAGLGWRETYGIIGVYGVTAGLALIIFVTEPKRGSFDPQKFAEGDEKTGH